MKADQAANQLLQASKKLIILPIGACEQHGPYLPIDTDLRIAQLVAEKLENKFSNNHCFLLPAIPYSCSWEHKGIGTIALSHTTIAHIIHDIAYNLKYWADPHLLILLNWHGGNNLLSSLAAEITAKENVQTAVINAISETTRIWQANHEQEKNLEDVHAGAIETSIIKAYWPDLVTNNIPTSAKHQINIQPSIMHNMLQTFNIHDITKDGIWGDPSIADADKGKEAIEQVTQSIYGQIQEILLLMDKLNMRGDKS